MAWRVSWKIKILCLGTGILTVGIWSMVAFGEEPKRKWQVSTSASYSSGDFGTSNTTKSVYVPFRIKRFFSRGDVSLTVPYVSITSDGTVTFIGGDRGGNDGFGDDGRGGDNSGPGSGGGSNSGPGSSCSSCHGGSGSSGSSGRGSSGSGSGGVGGTNTTVTTIAGGQKTESGLGDMTLAGRVYLVDEDEYIPAINITGRVKFPTADDGRGLGTGEFDEGVGVEISKQLTHDLIGYVDGGYTIIGEPTGSSFNNQWNYDVGMGYYVTDSLFTSVFYEEYAAIVSEAPNPRSVSFSLDLTPIPWLRLNAGGFVGLSNGSADHGVNGGVSVRF